MTLHQNKRMKNACGMKHAFAPIQILFSKMFHTTYSFYQTNKNTENLAFLFLPDTEFLLTQLNNYAFSQQTLSHKKFCKM